MSALRTDSTRQRAVPLSFGAVIRWLATFAGFPLGSVAARLVVGPVDALVPSLLGGLVSGLVLGAIQAWGLGRNRPGVGAWILSTSIGFLAGLTAGAAAVGYATDLASLAIQGAITGLAVGIAQAFVLVPRVGALAATWPLLLAGAWALGWTVTTAIGVQVDLQFTVFGSAGALTVTTLTLVLPMVLNRTARREQLS